MSEDTKFTVLVVVFISSVIGAVLLAAFSLDWVGCSHRWERAGLESSYGPLQGCMVKTPTGIWMPERQYINARVDVNTKKGSK